MATTSATDKEIAAAAVFMQRMLPHLLAGQDFETAGRAVLAHDRKLFEVATADNECGAFIRNELAVKVFDQVNREEHTRRQQRQAAEQARLAVLASLA